MQQNKFRLVYFVFLYICSVVLSALTFAHVLKWQQLLKVYQLLKMGVRYGITEKTACLFMLKVREVIGSSENHPMDSTIQVHEFVLGGYEQGKISRSYNTQKKKAITAVELTEQGKIKQMYALKIHDFSARSLQYMFVKHIGRTAKVITDKWKGYRLIAKAYNIKQIKSNNGMNFALELTVHKIKIQYSIT